MAANKEKSFLGIPIAILEANCFFKRASYQGQDVLVAFEKPASSSSNEEMANLEEQYEVDVVEDTEPAQEDGVSSHVPYKKRYDLRPCQLPGCPRTTTSCCVNENCQKHLCCASASGEYFDGKANDCPAEVKQFFEKLPREKRSCFIIFHCMEQPQLLD